MLGNYIGLATNDPKKYPKVPYLSDTKEAPKDMSDDDMELEAQRIAKMFGGEIL